MTTEREMTWREFIGEQTGAGPINTFYHLLTIRAGVKYLEEKLPPPYQTIYKEAQMIHKQASTKHQNHTSQQYYHGLYGNHRYPIGLFSVNGTALLNYINTAAFMVMQKQAGQTLSEKEWTLLEKIKRAEHDAIIISAGFVPHRETSERYLRFEKALTEYVQSALEEITNSPNALNAIAWVGPEFKEGSGRFGYTGIIEVET